MEHESLLQETRNKLEGDIQTLEKNFQEMLKSKNEMELNLHEEQEKLEKAENDLLQLKNQFDTLNVKKSRLEVWYLNIFQYVIMLYRLYL